MAIVGGNDSAALQRAAAELAAGELVAFPTETVYGLGARADDDAAVAKIFAAKGRPADHPLIVHVGDAEGARAFASEWPATARRLADAFWPGPLTVIVPRRSGMGTAAAAGQTSIGLRCPSHPVARELLAAAAALGVAGVAGPSANRFGRISPTTAAHVHEEFGDALTSSTAASARPASNRPSSTAAAARPRCCVRACSPASRSRPRWASRCARPGATRRAPRARWRPTTRRAPSCG